MAMERKPYPVMTYFLQVYAAARSIQNNGLDPDMYFVTSCASCLKHTDKVRQSPTVQYKLLEGF
jgi:hypothetical protein